MIHKVIGAKAAFLSRLSRRMTLRYPYEVRREEDYFDDIENEKVPKDMLELATHTGNGLSGAQPSMNPDRSLVVVW